MRSAGIGQSLLSGLKFFAHKKGADCDMHEGGETAEHLELKSLLVKAAKAAGWEAELEVPSPQRDWIADVMAAKGERRIALEVQWSRQGNEDFVRRQERYEADGVECIRFVAPKNSDNAGTVPSHTIGGAPGEWHIPMRTTLDRYSRTELPFEDAVVHILRGDYRFHSEPYVQAYSMDVAMTKCWREACGKWFTLWRLEDLQVKTRCGLEGTIEGVYHLESRMFLQDRIERIIADQVLPWLEHEQVDLPRAAKLITRKSKPAEKTYLAYCCPHCGVISGDNPIAYGGTRWRTFVVHRRLAVPFRTDARGPLHLCIDRGKGQCSQEVPTVDSPAFPDGTGSYFGFSSELLVDRLDRLPRKDERSTTPRR